MKRARRELAAKSPQASPAEQQRRRAAADARKQTREQMRGLVKTSPELFMIRSPASPSIADMNRFAEARLAAAAQAECVDPFMKIHLVCSPKRDGDATTRAVREVQLGASEADFDAVWLTAVARVAFGTERFVRRVGLLRPASLEEYVETCVGAAVAVASEGYHACTDAYTAGRLGWNDERTAWRMAAGGHAEFLQEKHEARFAPVAVEAWRLREHVRAAIRTRQWSSLEAHGTTEAISAPGAPGGRPAHGPPRRSRRPAAEGLPGRRGGGPAAGRAPQAAPWLAPHPPRQSASRGSVRRKTTCSRADH